MNKRQLAKFKKVFEEQREQLLYSDRILREDFQVNSDDRYDEIDQATADTEQSMRMRLRNREILYLRKIEKALERIDEGTFGLCDSCDEPIEVRRIEARPTATLCLSCKEEEERREVLSASGLRHKSMGETFTRVGL